MAKDKNFILFLLFFVCLVSGCAVNPVTGQNELSLIPESQELQIGQEQYLASLQMQGGSYMLDQQLNEYIRDVGQRLARVSDRPLPYEFSIINNSVPNAWALPGGKIAINRGLLLELESEAELAAVLGHEIVHAAAKHGAKSMQRGMLLQGVVMAATIAMQDQNYSELAVGGAQIAAQLISSKYGRNAETESDLHGMRYMAKAGYDPMAAVRLQETFVRLSTGKKQNWLDGLFASHPPSQERVDANKKTARELNKQGELNKERYQDKITYLKKTADAYAIFDQGKKELEQKEYKKAQALAEKAIALEPREGFFHGLMGDIMFSQQRFDQALAYYNQAISQPGDFFYYYLKRGEIREKFNDKENARRDFEKSISLLPTATAHYSLGTLELQGGDKQKAKQHFKTASSSKSALGSNALSAFVLLDVEDNPLKYIKIQTALDKQGYVMIRIRNDAPVSIRDIRLQISFPDPSSGRITTQDKLLWSTLGSRTTLDIGLAIGPYQSTTILNNIRILIKDVTLVK